MNLTTLEIKILKWCINADYLNRDIEIKMTNIYDLKTNFLLLPKAQSFQQDNASFRPFHSLSI